MANKQLTARVKLNTSDAERKLQRLNTLFRNLDKASNGVGANKTIEQQLTRSQNKVQNIVSQVKSWAKNQQAVTSAMRSSNGILGSIGGKLKMLASTYLGVMGTKAAITTSDTITATQNKLNNLNDGNENLTQHQMDKMYASANKVRMAYTDMAANASKSMTLAGDAFQGNMDNAIRFQEIMAETYTLGGASAEEMHTSMYQMIQALGAGILAGDELRSVREGAPLAYKAIEKFAQGVYKSTDSLKDMASQGKITSEMVVAAVMNAGDSIDKQFENTYMTFGQAWNRIKNAAVKAFEPVSNSLRDMLNRAANNGAFEKIEQAFWNISKALQIVFKVIENTIAWIADNWNWLKHIIVGALILIAGYYLITAGIAVYSAIQTAIAWIQVYWPLLLVALAIFMVIYGFYLFQQGVIKACDLIVIALLAVAVVLFLIFGWEVALVVAIVALVIWLFEFVCWLLASLVAVIVDVLSAVWNIVLWIVQAIASAVAWLIAMIWNLIVGIIKVISTATMFVYTLAQWAIAGIVNLSMGLWNVISAVCQNIGIAFQNAWNGALSAFWNFIASCMEGLDWLAKPISAIAELFGKSFNYEGFTANLRSKADAYSAKQKDYVSVSDAWSSGWNTMKFDSMSDNLSSGWNVMDFADANKWAANTWNFMDGAHTGYVDPIEWGDAAYGWASGIKGAINDWGSQFQKDPSKEASDKSSWLDNLGKELGVDFGNMTGADGFPNADDKGYDTKGAYKAPSVDDMVKNAIGDTADNTGKMADSMELAEEDLAYLRKIADMEWKKEYTTASITVDMSNYNTINGDSDLDGIVTKLSDKLREELNVVANGVYAD